MSNSFDFELVASDQVSEAIDRINEAVRDLEPKLDKTKEGLKLGGQETADGLSGFISRLENMSKSARDNVQFIGDMVPPLKMVGELTGKMGALGLAGAAGYGLKQVAYGFREASRQAYNLDVSAKNAGMRVDDFTRLSGAMRILGADSESANASIEGIFKAFNEAASGKNEGVMAAMAQIGAQIQKNSDGSVNTLKTLESIAKIFPTLRPEQQKSAADALGLTPELLALMRDGERMKKLLAKSDEFGLTVDPALNQQLSEVNGTMNELSASWDGLWQRSKNKALKTILSDGSVKDGLEGVTDLFTNGDFTGLSHALGFINSNDAEKLRRIQNDKELYNSLPRSERGQVDAGFMTDAVRKRYDANYRATDSAIQLQNDLSAISQPQPALSRSRHEVRATGRSKCQDLVDCSAEWPNNVINASNALEIASRLASYYGITVTTDVDELVKVPQFTLNWGESPQEVIDRVARWSALLYYDQPDGNLLLTRVGTRRAASGIAEGVNVEQAYYRKSMADRFSDYVGVSMSVSPIAGYSPDTAYDAVTLATARDPEAARMRYRKHISIVESTLMATQQAQSAIDWEMNRRYGRSKQLSVTIDSWRDKDGKLWEPNTLIPVDLPTLRLPKTELLLAEVTYMRDDYGTHARMTLMPPEAFSVQPYAFYQNLAGFNT